jgi:CheY-like chemotaxis protein
MQTTGSKTILAVLEDLFFTVKINESAKRAGLPVEFVKSEIDAMLRAKTRPALIIIDLNFHGSASSGFDALRLIADLKADEETKNINLLGYVSHVQGELKLKAQEAGCNMVMPRSAFSQSLTQILMRYTG